LGSKGSKDLAFLLNSESMSAVDLGRRVMGGKPPFREGDNPDWG
jgi:hypothetical protein